MYVYDVINAQMFCYVGNDQLHVDLNEFLF